MFALGPALRRSGDSGRAVNRHTAAEFGVLVNICFFLILVTGISLTFDRLSEGVTGIAYVAILALKIALSVWIFLLARSRRRRSALMEAHRPRPQPPNTKFGKIIRAVSGYNAVVIIGVFVLLLADILNTLYEIAIR